MAIALICNKDLTVPFEALARHMRDLGEDIVWLSPSTRWTKWLVGRGWPRDSIFNLPDRRAEWAAMPELVARAKLAPFECDPTVTAANITLMCRGLVHKPRAYAFAYLAVAVEALTEFCREKQVEAMLGEGTWGFELAAWLVAQKLGIEHYNPVRTRLPADRCCLVDAVRGHLVEANAPQPEHFEAARTFYEDWTTRPRPAFGFVLGGAGIGGVEFVWLQEMRQIAANAADDAGDETLWPLRKRIMDRARRIPLERRVGKFLRNRPPAPDAPYLLYCMHHQPEAAIDVVGAFNADQFRLIETLARLLPTTHRLHVRAHRAGLADFPMRWWRELERLPGVVIVDPFEDIWPQMKGSAATVTVCGTVLYEAAMLGVPALGLGPVHFDELYALPATRRSTPLDWPVADLLDPAQRERWAPSEEKRIAYLAKLIANSGLGIVDDIRQPASVQSDPNWQREPAAFISNLLRQTGVVKLPKTNA